MPHLRRIKGALLGTAAGDALGLPREGLSPQRALRLFPDPSRHALLPGLGMFSDDTEHAAMTAQALIASQGDPDRFARSLAWRMRFWLLGLPAGVGLATGRAILKLWLGFPPSKSGVFSAGNGPAMRAPIIGAALGHDLKRMQAFITRSTRLTHSDPKADAAAFAVALAAARASTPPAPSLYLEELKQCLPDSDASRELLTLIGKAARSAEEGRTCADLARDMGLAKGIGGYSYHTVPMVLCAWFRHPGDFKRGIEEIIACGGDADTTAAILGGILGAGVGAEGIPQPWLQKIFDWPRSPAWLARVAERLAYGMTSKEGRPVPLFWPAIPLRNLFFLVVVLLHGFRRLLPPY